MKIIYGKINASNTFGYWRVGADYHPDVAVGDYAIVQNKNNYDLIRIIGITETKDNFLNNFTSDNVKKEVIRYIAKSTIEDYQAKIYQDE